MNSASPQAASTVSAHRWLILVALVWSQLAFAGHQLDHAEPGVGEVCEACLQIDRDGDTLPGDPAATSQPAKEALAVSVAESSAFAPHATQFQARASP